MSEPGRWEIWDAEVYFEDNPTQAKKRPVLVVGKEQYFIIALKITSHDPREEYFGEHIIVKWKEAGLTKESVVRCTKKVKLKKEAFISLRGKLQGGDIIMVQQLLHFIEH